MLTLKAKYNANYEEHQKESVKLVSTDIEPKSANRHKATQGLNSEIYFSKHCKDYHYESVSNTYH